ncbi:hypothetical protein GQ600_3606 [Phytophthora cactorum]|nr:hypothetical protein GQ600_3606 [Phytophthora cactorum]
MQFEQWWTKKRWTPKQLESKLDAQDPKNTLNWSVYLSYKNFYLVHNCCTEASPRRRAVVHTVLPLMEISIASSDLPNVGTEMAPVVFCGVPTLAMKKQSSFLVVHSTEKSPVASEYPVCNSPISAPAACGTNSHVLPASVTGLKPPTCSVRDAVGPVDQAWACEM